jgi:hypothetical protein
VHYVSKISARSLHCERLPMVGMHMDHYREGLKMVVGVRSK